jgi:ABC-type multidrug transport system fused ATPase/permease subunit|tara:strand:- start:952 stop:2664 length:1713 start_codon:yes stop_codon:yes gene_type:complete
MNLVMNDFLNIYRLFKLQVNTIAFFSILIAFLEVLGLAALVPVLPLIINSTDGVVEFEILDTTYRFKILTVLIVLPLLYFAKNTIVIMARYINNKMVFSIKSDAECMTINYYLRCSAADMTMESPNEVTNKLVAEIQIFTFNLLQASVVILTELFVSSLLLLALIYYDFEMFLILIIPLLVFMVPILIISSKMQASAGQDNRLANEGMLGEIEVALGAFREIRIYSLYGYIFGRFRDKSLQVASSFTRSQSMSMAGFPIVESILVGVLFGFLYYLIGIIKLPNDEVIVAISIYAFVALRSLPGISRIATSINQVKFGHRTIKHIIDAGIFTRDNVHDKANHYQGIKNLDRLQISGLGFSYSQSVDVFKDVNVVIPAGSRVGLIGESGSGKSTLVNILAGLQAPSEGKVIYHAGNSECSPREFLLKIGYVPQDVYVINASLAENIAIGVPLSSIDFDYISLLCSRLLLDKILDGKSPSDVLLNARSTDISGGQRARIGLARALYRKPEVLILDEITSSLDSDTSKIVLKNMFDLLPDATITIMNAHKLEDLETFDKVYRVNELDIVSVDML